MKQSPGGSLAAVVVIAVVAASLAVASAGPAAAQARGYHDVPSDAYYSAAVSALGAQGVFDRTECAGGGFCPDDPIDRKTMAVWIVRMLDRADPLLISESRFDDVEATSFHAPFIERMYHLSVTRGCGDGSWTTVPTSASTGPRWLRSCPGATNSPPDPTAALGDVASGAWYADDLARLVASGITRGCEDGTVFCPDDPTTRGQMATFLHRAESPQPVGAQRGRRRGRLLLRRVPGHGEPYRAEVAPPGHGAGRALHRRGRRVRRPCARARRDRPSGTGGSPGSSASSA